MGRGPREANDPPMRKPDDLSTGAEGGTGARGKDSASYCSSLRELPFLIDRSGAPEVGDEISLRIGDPVEVVRNGDRVGSLLQAEGQSMKGCIALGYRMEGTVKSLAADLTKGVIMIAGSQEVTSV